MHWCGWSPHSAQNAVSDFFLASAALDSVFNCDSPGSEMGDRAGSGPKSWDSGTEPAKDCQHAANSEAAIPPLGDSSPSATLSNSVTAAPFRNHTAAYEYAAGVGSIPLQSRLQSAAPRVQSSAAMEAPSSDYIYNLLLPPSAFEGPLDADSPVVPYDSNHALSRSTVEPSEAAGREGMALKRNPPQIDAICRPEFRDLAQACPDLLSSMHLLDTALVPGGRQSLANAEQFEDPSPQASRRPRPSASSSTERRAAMAVDEVEDGSQILARMSTIHHSDEQGRRASKPQVSKGRPRCPEPENRTGKKRVYNPCHACQRDKHIRSNSCQWCNAPKGPPAKRRRRSRSSE
jgi:hypothetical protein